MAGTFGGANSCMGLVAEMMLKSTCVHLVYRNTISQNVLWIYTMATIYNDAGSIYLSTGALY